MPKRWDRKHVKRPKRAQPTDAVDKNVNRADTSRHEVLVPADPGGKTVRWYCEKDGSSQAKAYFNATKKCRASLLSIARTIASLGYVSKTPERGHPLHRDFVPLYVLKPPDDRFIGWFHGDAFYIAIGAQKNPKRQDVDYRAALKKYQAFLESFT